MPELTPGMEKMAIGYAYQIKAGTKTIDTIPDYVPANVKDRVIELVNAV